MCERTPWNQIGFKIVISFKSFSKTKIQAKLLRFSIIIFQPQTKYWNYYAVFLHFLYYANRVNVISVIFYELYLLLESTLSTILYKKKMIQKR